MRIISSAAFLISLLLVSDAHAHVGGVIAAGSYHTCALSPTNQVYCWGDDSAGQLGSGRLLSGPSPTSHALPGLVVSASGSGPLLVIEEVSAGSGHTCARNGFTSQLLCWGSNRLGQFGNGERAAFSSRPVFVLDPVTNAPLNNANAISIGADYSCAIASDPENPDSVACWGDNQNWVLGDNSSNDSVLPIRLIEPGAVAEIAANGNRVCALEISGPVYCWGRSAAIGDDSFFGNFVGSSVPVAVKSSATELLLNVASLDVSSDSTCALLSSSFVVCWGDNTVGEIGNGSFRGPVDLPSLVVDPVGNPLSGVVSLSGGDSHFCAVKTDSSLVCWGANNSGQLGDNDANDSGVARQVIDNNGNLLRDVIAVSAGGFHTCAMKRDGSIWCWGENGNGQLGNGTFKDSPVAVPVDFQTIFRDSFESS
jgi:alpha-tubulin suppressor-like RCC1 family protein